MAPDPVLTARLAGRLLGLLPRLHDAWIPVRAKLDPALREAADLAVNRLRDAIESEVDSLYRHAFAVAASRVTVGDYRNHAAAPLPGEYWHLAEAIASALDSTGRFSRRARHRRRLGADLRATVALLDGTGVSDAATAGWRAIASRWADPARPYRLPQDPPGPAVFRDGADIVVHTGNGPDRVSVESDETGAWRVVVNGREFSFPAEASLTLRLGDGDDFVSVTGRRGVTVLGGPGDDIVLGGDGPDFLYGGPGRDYLDGAAGENRLYPGPGGGYAAPGSTVDDPAVDPRDRPQWIRIDGTVAFVQRVRADLTVLRASPVGRSLLAELGRMLGHGGSSPGRDVLLIAQDEASSASWTSVDLPDGGRFTVFVVAYNPSRGVRGDGSPPIVALFHELAHVYAFARGSVVRGRHDDPADPDRVSGPDGLLVGAPNDERAVVGLPVDHDGDPTTPTRIHPAHPYRYTENALRDEIGWPQRRRYGC